MSCQVCGDAPRGAPWFYCRALLKTPTFAKSCRAVRHRTINKLEGRKTTIPADQWAQILTFALLCKSPDPSSSDDFRKGFEVVADTEEDHLKLIFRQRIGELTVSKLTYITQTWCI